MKKYFLLLVGFVALPLIAAEKETITLNNYTNQVGIIGGLHNGLSYKGYLVDKNFAFSADAAYDVYFKSLDLLTNFMYKGEVYDGKASTMHLFAGGGISFGSTLSNVLSGKDYVVGDKIPVGMGANAIIGLEWFYKKAPLSISVDYRPGAKAVDFHNFKTSIQGNYYDFNVGLHWYL